jgi:hypothetical protein
MSDPSESILASRQLEQVRRLLVFICAWLCAGFTAATVVAVYLAVTGRLDWVVVVTPIIAGFSSYLSVVRHEGVAWSRNK